MQLRYGLLAELVAAPGEGDALAAFLASAISAPFKSVSVGGSHSRGLRTDDTVTCWGDDAYGQWG